LEVTLLTGRTVDQGTEKEAGKLSAGYMENVAVCELHSDDMKRLGVKDGGNVKVTTQFGSIVLKAKKSRRLKTPGAIFVPYGPWANQVLASSTGGTGMPSLKGVKATVEPSNLKVLSIQELLSNMQEKAR
jgi:formylmethanofuran dehydrogenase subunit D